MVKGLDLFKENFQPFEDCYTVIGGTACSMLMENATLEFRATQDIDMILLVDSPRFNEFADQLLKFIDDGDYTCEIKKQDEYLGTNISITDLLGNTRLPVSIDIGFGDMIIPLKKEMSFPVLLDMECSEDLRLFH